jgi:hypothetical protein
VNLADWTALGAIGALTLAFVTVIALGVTVWLSVSERHNDERKRDEDRKRDDRLRAEQQERDDRLRQQAAEELERRELAERRAREDYEARQVVVKIEAAPQGRYPELTHRITVTAPRAYPVKQVDAYLAGWSTGQMSENMSVRPTGFRPDDPYADEDRFYFHFWSHSPAELEKPIVRWVDWRGNLYYQYRDYTDRFSPNTEWIEAATKIDEWIRIGPKPD